MSAFATLSGDELLVPALELALVASVPLNTPVLIPVSVSVTVSDSLVRVFTTVTCTVSAAAGLVFRSGSVTVTVTVAPGARVEVIETMPVVPRAVAITTSSAVVARASNPSTLALPLVTVR